MFFLAVVAGFILWGGRNNFKFRAESIPRFLRKLWSHWQGLSALFVAVALFWFSADLLHRIDPTAGTFDLGYLQRPLVAAAYFLFMTFLAWAAFHIDFPLIDKWLDEDYFYNEWKIKLTPAQRIGYTLAVFFGLLAAAVACLFAVPV